MIATFRKYDHLERMGHSDCSEIEIGMVHVFSKIDGTNGCVWVRPIEHPELGIVDIEICCGSRNRQLSAEADNQGFYAWVNGDDPKAVSLREYLKQNPHYIVYGEWMVPHTLKTYREEVWRRFWIFDVFDVETGKYVPWEKYGENLKFQEMDVIEPLCTIENASQEQLQVQCETNTYLIADGAGLGEGVIVKNYAWKNRHGQQPWMKIVRNAFKEENRRTFGHPEKQGAFQVEAAIVEEFVTVHLVGKTRAKVVTDVANEKGIDLTEPNAQQRVEAENRYKVIPQLLGRVYHDLLSEETWAFVKKHKNPIVNFKLLQSHCTAAVKRLAQDLF